MKSGFRQPDVKVLLLDRQINTQRITGIHVLVCPTSPCPHTHNICTPNTALFNIENNFSNNNKAPYMYPKFSITPLTLSQAFVRSQNITTQYGQYTVQCAFLLHPSPCTLYMISDLHVVVTPTNMTHAFFYNYITTNCTVC